MKAAADKKMMKGTSSGISGGESSPSVVAVPFSPSPAHGHSAGSTSPTVDPRHSLPQRGLHVSHSASPVERGDKQSRESKVVRYEAHEDSTETDGEGGGGGNKNAPPSM